jgi:hypothetical protein
MVAMIWPRVWRARQKARHRTALFREPNRAKNVRGRSARGDTKKAIARIERNPRELFCDPLLLIFASFARATQRTVAARNDSDDLRGITSECRRTFACVEYAESTARAGTCVHQSPATRERRRGRISKSRDLFRSALHRLDRATLVTRKQQHDVVGVEPVERARFIVALLRRDV